MFSRLLWASDLDSLSTSLAACKRQAFWLFESRDLVRCGWIVYAYVLRLEEISTFLGPPENAMVCPIRKCPNEVFTGVNLDSRCCNCLVLSSRSRHLKSPLISEALEASYWVFARYSFAHSWSMARLSYNSAFSLSRLRTIRKINSTNAIL